MALPNFSQLFSRSDPVLASLPGSQLRAMRSVYQEGSSLVGLVRLPDGRPAVVKALHKERLMAQPALVDQVLSEILSQEELGPEVLYPGGVPALLAVHEDETHVHLVFEYGGEALMPMIGGLTWEERDALTDEIARTLLPLLAGLHAKASGFSYNDLKPEQLLINRCLDGTLAPRLCDFGGMTALGSGEVLAFTPRYAPPEAAGEILKFVYDRGAPSYLGDLVGPKYDAWALAASVAVVQAGRHPWETAEAAAALARGDGDAHDAAMARRIKDAPRAHRDLPDILALRPAKLAFLDCALDPDPAARPSPLELCFGEYGESLGLTDCLDWVPAVGEAVLLLADLAERRRARGDEARAAAAAAHAAEVAALCTAAAAEREAAGRREAALQGRVAALEEAARAGAAREVRKDEAAAAAASAHAAELAALRAAASAARDEAAQREGALQGRVAALDSQAQRKDEAAAALRAALADERAAFQAQVAALQARLAELEGASRAALVAAAADGGARGGGSECGTSSAGSVCSGDDGAVEHAFSAGLLASRPASPRLSLDNELDAGAEQAKGQQQIHLGAASHAASRCDVSVGAAAAAKGEVPISAVADGCGEPRAASHASSRSVSPSGLSKLPCADVAALFATEHGSGSCTGAGIAAPVAGAMKPCAVARAAATCSTDDVSCSGARGDACAALDAAPGCEADAAAVLAVVMLTNTCDGACIKQLFSKSGGAKRPRAVRGGRDVRTPAERVQGAAHKLRKEAGKGATALKGLLCMRAPAAY